MNIITIESNTMSLPHNLTGVDISKFITFLDITCRNQIKKFNKLVKELIVYYGTGKLPGYVSNVKGLYTLIQEQRKEDTWQCDGEVLSTQALVIKLRKEKPQQIKIIKKQH